MNSTFVINLGFWGNSIIGHFGTPESCVQALSEYLSKGELNQLKKGFNGKPCNGMCSDYKNGKLSIYLNFPLKQGFTPFEIGVIAHESLHAAIRVLNHFSIPNSSHYNEELLCMLQQHIIELILNQHPDGQGN